MEFTLLLPNKFKKVGLLLLLPSFILGIFNLYYEFEFGFLTIENTAKGDFGGDINLTDELALTGTILGLLFIAFAREKQEDEYIESIRLKSLQWAVLVNYFLLLIATWLVHGGHGFTFIDVMIYNMLTVLIIFIVRFHLVLRKNKVNNPEYAS
jgi:peptidoglycan/LPS O-acetylase OafA/YrhL